MKKKQREFAMRDKNAFRGCLIGGAAGDALGYAVEFESYDGIMRKYGKHGIRDYELQNGKAIISDDTQMTLFTANGLLLAKTDGILRAVTASYPSYVRLCYMDWLKTQSPERRDSCGTASVSWLLNLPQLHVRRAPGNTCLSALHEDRPGSIASPLNTSKGCGGVMRAAPVGLCFKPGDEMGAADIAMTGAQIAALTHGHELGYIPAAALVHIINSIVYDSGKNLKSVIINSIEAIAELFRDARHIREFTALMQKAVSLAESPMLDIECIRELGEGWVGEEALAIAVYASLAHFESFEEAVICSVNHSGDSDSTGSIAGNIMGVYLGFENIPGKFLNGLELKEYIIEVADDLYAAGSLREQKDIEDDAWMHKYVEYDYPAN